MTSISGHHALARMIMLALKYGLYAVEAAVVILIVLFILGALFGIIYIPRSNLHGF